MLCICCPGSAIVVDCETASFLGHGRTRNSEQGLTFTGAVDDDGSACASVSCRVLVVTMVEDGASGSLPEPKQVVYHPITGVPEEFHEYLHKDSEEYKKLKALKGSEADVSDAADKVAAASLEVRARVPGRSWRCPICCALRDMTLCCPDMMFRTFVFFVSCVHYMAECQKLTIMM